MCTVGAIKYMIYGVILDDYVSYIKLLKFFYERILTMMFNLIAIGSMFMLSKDELGEIYNQMQIEKKLGGQGKY